MARRKHAPTLQAAEERSNTPLIAALVIGTLVIGGGLYWARGAHPASPTAATASPPLRDSSSIPVSTAATPAVSKHAEVPAARPTYHLTIEAPRFVYIGKSVQFRTRYVETGELARLSGWRSSNPGIARVDPSTGRVTGVSEGRVTISVRFGDLHPGTDLDVVMPSLGANPEAKVVTKPQ